MMQFPVSMPNDGKVDLVIQGMVSSCPSLPLSHSHAETPSLRFRSLFFFSSQLSRVEMLKGYDGAEKGAMYWSDTVSIILGSPHKIADHLS
jgi:hypothetical protein